MTAAPTQYMKSKILTVNVLPNTELILTHIKDKSKIVCNNFPCFSVDGSLTLLNSST